MKIFHLSDLHLGKNLNGFSLLEDQTYILARITDLIKQEAPQAIMIAGDIFDKSVASTDALELFDNFLVELAGQDIPVFIISGNHDSAGRVAFGGRLMCGSGIHIAPVYHGTVTPVTLTDEYGTVNFYMLPFLKPVHVRTYFPEDTVDTYSDAMKIAVREMNIDESERNILITHQFVTGASRTESEDFSVGGTDNIDADVFAKFDYVALGHIHRSQSCGYEHIRYCGTPLKYSFSEARDEKSITVIEIKEKGNLSYSFLPLVPMHDMVELCGTYNELMEKSFYAGTSYPNDYVHITLTDEEDVPNALNKLRTVYPNIMKLNYKNARTGADSAIGMAEHIEVKSPLELFSELYHAQNNRALSTEQTDFLQKIIQEIWEKKHETA